MGHLSNAADLPGSAASIRVINEIREEWRLAREALAELQLAQVGRTNLFVVGNGAVPVLLALLGLETQGEPVARWRPGQPFELPAPDRIATLILQDVHALTPADQHRLLDWLDQAAGRVRVVSTSGEPLWPRVKTGIFSEALYYRLNTVYVDVGSAAN